MSDDQRLEALLFYKATPQKRRTVAALLALDEAALAAAIATLRGRLASTALTLVATPEELQLTTAPTAAEFIATLRKEELKSDIGKAGAETLAIVLYREPVSRAEIDRIRGVNSGYTLRSLETRGLVARVSDTKHGTRYRITSDLLRHLGVSEKQDLPQFSAVMNQLDAFLASRAA